MKVWQSTCSVNWFLVPLTRHESLGRKEIIKIDLLFSIGPNCSCLENGERHFCHDNLLLQISFGRSRLFIGFVISNFNKEKYNFFLWFLQLARSHRNRKSIKATKCRKSHTQDECEEIACRWFGEASHTHSPLQSKTIQFYWIYLVSLVARNCIKTTLRWLD